MKRRAIVLTAFLGMIAATLSGQLRSAQNPPEPRFNQVYDYAAWTSMLRGYAAAYPDWVQLESIGKSSQGRDIWLLTISNPRTGDPVSKPAMYIDGNTHANEVQGTETAMYTVDFLLKNYGKLDRITEVMDRATFYIVPMVNPDGRALWFEGPSTPHFPRTVVGEVDDDRDGLVNEDGYDDIDGNNVITQMRKKVPMGQGNYRVHPKDPRVMVETEAEEMGDYILLGSEGYDNDGDGQLNEDQVGYIDPNRSWGWGWMPRYVQAGAGDYPLQIPETRAIANWAYEHPNIVAVQSYHNSGGMILRGPGAKLSPAPYPPSDIAVYDLLGEEGEKMLPGYNYWVTWEDLYTVYGDTTDHFYGINGAFALTNELYQEERAIDLDNDGEISDEERMRFNDVLSLGRQFVEWTEHDHPQYGTVEIGGFRQDVGRVPEGWMLEEEIHRNHAFIMFNAHHLPMLKIGEPIVKRVARNLWRVEIPVVNERGIPSMAAIASQHDLHRPDIATIRGAKVISSGVITNPYLDRIQIQEHRPERLMVDGVPGLSTRHLFFLLEGNGDVEVTYDSLKGGEVSKRFTLR